MVAREEPYVQSALFRNTGFYSWFANRLLSKAVLDNRCLIKIQAGNPAVHGGEERDRVRNNRRTMAERLPILNGTCMNVGYYM
jgi:hypothetical protein